MKIKNIAYILTLLVFIIFMVLTKVNNITVGATIGSIFIKYCITMIKILPLTFVLIALFEVWVKKESVEKHLGKDAGFKSFLWAILLGGTTIGPMIVCLPVAAALHKKGARLSIIFTYIGAASICRVPMAIFESSYLGVKFTIIRYAVSIPLVIISSILMARFLDTEGYVLKEN